MYQTVATLFETTAKRFLQPEEVAQVNGYVKTVPDRLTTYRHLRDREMAIFGPVVEAIQAQMPEADPIVLERSLKGAILAVRTCAMAMLTDDASVAQESLAWVQQTQATYGTQAIDRALYPLVARQIKAELSPGQLALFRGFWPEFAPIEAAPKPAAPHGASAPPAPSAIPLATPSALNSSPATPVAAP
jgi:hypothetical protein